MGMYSLATGLSTFNNRSAIKVRVIRSYLVREKKGSADLQSQELVLHDPKNNQPLQQITELVGKTLLFQITAKSDHTAYRNTPFPVLRINNILKEHCSQLLKLEDNACNSNMQIILGDDDFLERAGATGEHGDGIAFGLSEGGASLEIEIFRDRVGEERC
nr:putative transposase [Ipomoea batatas]